MNNVRREINKIAIIGKGTAGCMAASHFANTHHAQIDWIYDPETPAQSVGEGSTLPLPNTLFNQLNLGYASLEQLGGSIKKGIRKRDYNGLGDYLHEFPLGKVGIHFSANALQSVTPKILEKRGINLVEKKIISHDDIDADYIIDCSGRPASLKEYFKAEHVLVNAVVTEQFQCPGPLFDYTLTVARPFGWVFAIPLLNRVSVGYLYNENINSKEEVDEDMEKFLKEYGFYPSYESKGFSFDSYYRKKNFTERATYNGNASFFLEPLEATSVGMVETINKLTGMILNQDFGLDAANSIFIDEMKAIEHMIMLHYFAGSKYDTEFWRLAKKKGEESTRELAGNNKFRSILTKALTNFSNPHFGELLEIEHGQWPAFSYLQNLKGLGIAMDVDLLVKEHDKRLNK